MNTQLDRASQLQAGTRLTKAKMSRALDQMRATLEQMAITGRRSRKP